MDAIAASALSDAQLREVAVIATNLHTHHGTVSGVITRARACDSMPREGADAPRASLVANSDHPACHGRGRAPQAWRDRGWVDYGRGHKDKRQRRGGDGADSGGGSAPTTQRSISEDPADNRR